MQTVLVLSDWVVSSQVWSTALCDVQASSVGADKTGQVGINSALYSEVRQPDKCEWGNKQAETAE